MNGRAAQGLLLVALIAAAATLYFRNAALRDRTNPAITASIAPDYVRPDSGVSPSTNGGGSGSPRAALPRIDAPLDVILEPLQARADAGDSRAACRLAMELIRCQGIEFLATIPGFNDSTHEANLEAKGDFDAADRVAAAEIERLRRQQECLSVPDSLKGQGTHYLVQAARAGEPEAMIRFADLQHWPLDGRGVYSDPEFDRWRRDASSMLHRALDAGAPEAPFYLMMGYETDSGGQSSLVPDDPVKAEAMHLLMIRLHGWNERPVPRPLDVASRARAQALARQWHEGPFKGRSYRGQNRATFPHPGQPGYGGRPREFCTGHTLAP